MILFPVSFMPYAFPLAVLLVLVLLLSRLLEVDFNHCVAHRLCRSRKLHILDKVRWYDVAFVHLECSGCFCGFGGKVLIGGQIANEV